jgi:predicted  nucleic acid-binding Zn-ribbon protein
MNTTIRSGREHLPEKGSYIRRPLLPVVLALAALLMTAACKNNESAVNTAQQVRADSSAVIRDSLQAQFSAARNQVDALATQNAQLDSQISKANAEVAKLEGKVKGLTRNNRSLNAKVKKDKKFIASLKDQMSDKERAYASKLGLLQDENNTLSALRDSLIAKYNRLKDLASVLHASNIRLAAIHLRRHGKQKRTVKARKADELKIDFDIDENRIAEDGMKKLYLIIKDPSGKLLTDNVSGAITASNGASLGYTVLKEISLKQDQPVKDVVVEWKQSGDYAKGMYDVAIYNGGYKIGEGEVALR